MGALTFPGLRRLLAQWANSVSGWFQDRTFRRLFLNAGKLLSGTTVGTLINLVVVALTARALGPEDYGILVFIMAFQTTIASLVTFNAWQAVIKFGSEALQESGGSGLRKLLKLGFALDITSGIVGTGLALALSGVAVALVGFDSSVRGLLMVYSILVLFSLSGTPTGILRLFDRFDLLGWTEVFNATIKLAAVLFCVLLATGLKGFVLAYLCAGVVGRLALFLLSVYEVRSQQLRGLAGEPLSGVFDRFDGIVHYVWTTNVNSTIRMLSRQVDELIIAGFVSAGGLGLYKIAKQFSTVLPRIIDPLYKSVFPELSQLWAKGMQREFLSLMKRSTAIVGGTALVAWMIFMAVGESAISVIVGTDYLNAYWPAVLYMLAYVVATFSFSFQPAMLAMGYPRESLLIQVIATGTYLVVLVPLVWFLGIVGASAAYLVYYVVWALRMLVRLRHQILPSLQGPNGA